MKWAERAPWCLVVTVVFLVRSSFTGSSDHMDLRRELGNLKEMMADIEGKLEQFNSLYVMSLEKRIKDIEAKLHTVMARVGDLNRKSSLLSEIHNDIDTRKELLQKISRGVEDLSRRHSNAIGRKHRGEIERLDKIGDNVQSLFQIFSGVNRKLDDLHVRMEGFSTTPTPTPDARVALNKKLGEFLDCENTCLVDSLRGTIRVGLDSLSRKLHLCAEKDVERRVDSLLDSRFQRVVEVLNGDLVEKMDKVTNLLDEVNCIRVGSDRPQLESQFADHAWGLSHKPRGDDSEAISPRESPGRIFRKLWRKLTEPIGKVEEKIDGLAVAFEMSTQKYYNETLAKLADWVSRERWWETCTRQYETLMDSNKDISQRLGYIESRQVSVHNICSKILVEVERIREAMEAGARASPRPTEESVGVVGKKNGYDIAQSCSALQMQGVVRSGIYTIRPKEAEEEFLAYCDLQTDGGGWTVFQRRGDYGEPRQNFTQDWETYKRGFGDFLQEFWLGNEKVHMLSTQEDVKLRVELQDFEGNMAYAEYTRFRVDSEEEQYKLTVGGYSGNATDSLSLHDTKLFSTVDRDNDEVASCCNCADTFKGGWWYYRCFEANLNGPYHTEPTDNGYFQGIIWERWKGDYSLYASEMKIRPLSFEQVRDP